VVELPLVVGRDRRGELAAEGQTSAGEGGCRVGPALRRSRISKQSAQEQAKEQAAHGHLAHATGPGGGQERNPAIIAFGLEGYGVRTVDAAPRGTWRTMTSVPGLTAVSEASGYGEISV